MGRRQINVPQQLKVLKSHQVVFNVTSESKAEEYLTWNTYFFKLKAFDNKFGKDPKGNYTHLEFSYLQDLATIDYHLRRVVSQMTSDIEHALKVRFNQLLMRHTSEDGIEVVSKFLGSRDKDDEIMKRSAYTKAMIDKFGAEPPAWLLWETCSMYVTNDFYRFFLRRIGYEDPVYSLLDGVRFLRNATAHNNCLLTAPAYSVKPTDKLSEYVEELRANPTNDMDFAPVLELVGTDPLIHDLACVLCAHINLVRSGGMVDSAMQEIGIFLHRMKRHWDWYQSEKNDCGELGAQLRAMETLFRAFQRFDRSDERYVLNRQPGRHKKHRRKRR
ncbi:Abi family protein [Bifidobacterium adolescentis]|jgi:hypothetical protein|uniref:Abi family protein n=1 Tax=Bifidobacterium adolescentis TaxID=1680 RepID=UPI0022E4F010|nr:Abi family protein [Bifidobacterium adolescentis]